MDARGYDYEGAYTPVPFWGGMATVDEYIKSIGGEKTTSEDGTTYTITATNQDDDLVEVLTMLVPDQKVQEAIKSITITEADGTYTVSVTNQDDVVSEVGTITVPTEYIKDVTVTNEDGVYTVSKTDQSGTTTEAGTIEVPEVDTTNIIAEINDSVVENETDGYDFHTLTETEYNGTKNEVGSFYLARQQVTNFNPNASGTNELTLPGVDQAGNETAVSIGYGGTLGVPSTTGGTDGVLLGQPIRTRFMLTMTGAIASGGSDEGERYHYLNGNGFYGSIFARGQLTYRPNLGYLFRHVKIPELSLTDINGSTRFVEITLTSSTSEYTLYGVCAPSENGYIIGVLPCLLTALNTDDLFVVGGTLITTSSINRISIMRPGYLSSVYTTFTSASAKGIG